VIKYLKWNMLITKFYEIYQNKKVWGSGQGLGKYMWPQRSRVQFPLLSCIGEYVKMAYNLGYGMYDYPPR
jgi:hypothetical protein